jgi:DNA-binding XRE family transcriptional regulator
MWRTMVSLYVCVRTDLIWVQIRGIVPAALLHVLRLEFGQRMIVRTEAWGRMRNVLDAPLYQRVPKVMSPGDYLRLFRRLEGLTLAELGRKLGGVGRQNVCNMERGRRPISRRMALQLARLFEVSPDKFIG